MDLLQRFSSLVYFCLLVLSRALPIETKPISEVAGGRTGIHSFVKSLTSRRSAGSSKYTTIQDVLIQCKNHWFLAVYNDGAVNGTLKRNSPYIKLQLQSVGHSAVRIFSPQTGRYVAMESAGNVYTTKNVTVDTRFRMSYESTSFTTFASEAHFKPPTQHVNGKHMFLSIRGTGEMRNGKRTRRHHKTSGYSVI